MDSLRSMSIKAALGLVALVFSAGAAAQINPNQIGWTVGTTGCSTATYPWVPADNACEAPGGGGGGLNGVNAQTTSYTAVSGDNGKNILFNCASGCGLTLPTSVPAAPWTIFVSNEGLAALSVVPTSGSSLLNSLGSPLGTGSLNPGMGVSIWSDGTNYHVNQGGIMTGSSVVPVIVQSADTSCGGLPCSLSFTGDVTPGDAIVVEFAHADTTSYGISDAQGDSFVLTNTETSGPGAYVYWEFVACNVTGGPTTISSSYVITVVAAYEIANVASPSCIDAYNSGVTNSASSLSTGSIATTQNNDFILVEGMARTGPGTFSFSEDNGYTEILNPGLVADAINYESWYGIQASEGSVSDTVNFNVSTNMNATILALKPAASSTIIRGDLIAGGPLGNLQPLHAGAAGEVLTSNGPGAMSSYQPQAPTQSFTWPPSAAGPTFSPAAGSYGTGVSVTDTCPGSATPWISAGTTPVAGATGITLTASSTLYGSCQGNGYLTTAAAGYTVTPGFTVTNNGYVNGSGSSVTSATLSTFSTALTNPSVIFVEEYAVGAPSSFPVPTDTAGNTYVDCGPGKILYNSNAVTLECFYALNTHTTASNIVTIHASSSVTYMNGTAFEVTGGATSSPIDGGSGAGYSSLANGTGGSSGANALHGNAITPAGSGDLIIGMFAGANAIPTAGTSPNAYTAVNVSAHAVSEYFYQLVSASIDATAGSTYSGDAYGNITVALKP